MEENKENNRYAPPSAEVKDAASGLPPPPRAVRLACLLILAAMGLGLITLLPGMRAPMPADSMVAVAVATVISVVLFGGLTVWLTVQIHRGTGWARWAMLAYQLIGWSFGWDTIAEDLSHYPLSAGIDLATFIMESSACVMLFFGPGARWFAALAALAKARAGQA